MKEIVQDIVERTKFKHIIVLIIVSGYVFQSGFRESVNGVINSLFKFPASVSEKLTSQNDPESLLTVFTTLVIFLLTLIVVMLIGMALKEAWKYFEG